LAVKLPLSQVKVARHRVGYFAAMEPNDNSDELTLSPETAFFIIVKAREFDEQVAPTDPDSGSNPADDREVDVLEEDAEDPVEQELEAALSSLNIDEQLDLLALTWLGRSDFPSFAQARKAAEDVRDKHIPSYLMGTPKLGDYVEEGLAQLGYSLEDFEKNRL
jgi:Protein of unknown function (DUF3775)